MNQISFDKRIFRPVLQSDNSCVNQETLFRYRQENKLVWAEYAGGEIVKGFLIAILSADGSLEMTYQHMNQNGNLMSGKCHSVPEILHDGRIRLHERWQWTSGDCSQGTSMLEEISEAEYDGLERNT